MKIGHGGTLDPMATGVLIIGVGKGTKHLQRFLECTKGYDATMIFGTSTDTYDILGKSLGVAPYAHITPEKVEGALEQFRGKIMQRPPIYSALRMNGKRLYEYAREGKELPLEIQERPVTVEELSLLDWLPPGAHDYKLRQDDETAKADLVEAIPELKALGGLEGPSSELKRNREESADNNESVEEDKRPSKRLETNDDGLKSLIHDDENADAQKQADPEPGDSKGPEEPLGPPAVRLRMTVTSGFYVRSLCHDLGKSLSSSGIMSALVRTRQGEFELGKNVLPYEDLDKGETIWGPKVKAMLESWQLHADSD